MKKNEFSPEEWDILADAPYLIGLSVIQIDYTLPGSSQEFFTLCEVCHEAKVIYKDHELISAVLSYRSPENSDDQKMREMSSEELWEKIKKIVTILDERVSYVEAVRFKEFLLEIAHKVAHAYSEDFLGLGKKVSRKETIFLLKLKECLGLP